MSANKPLIGSSAKSLPHESAVGHVTGRARYTADLPEPKGLLVAWPVCAPHARARVEHIEIAEALSMPGVVHVLTGSDVLGENDTGPIRHDEPLFPQEVSHHGQAVAWLLAEDEASARTAAARVHVIYAPLEPVLTIEEALQADSFLSEPRSVERGDCQTAFSKAVHVLDGALHVGGQDHFYLETHASLALLDEEGHLLVHSSTQHPTETQAIVVRVLGWPRHRVVVQSLRMGGGFGGKETQANAFAAVAALGAQRTGRPVRVRLNRRQDMQMTGKRHPMLARYRVGFDEEGMLQGLEIDLFSAGGWSLDLSEAVLFRALCHLDNAYFVPNMRATGRVCKTNTVSNTAMRGFGGPQGMLIIEEIIDRVARFLNLPSELVRERNFYRGFGETATTHYGQHIDDNRLERIWSELMATSDFVERKRACEVFNAAHPYRRRALAITPVKFGISFNTVHLNQAGAFVLIYEDGSVGLNHGGTEMGQGLHTKMRQIAARVLGVPLETIRVMPTRTDKVPNTSATAASSGTDLNGAAVQNACEILLGRIAAVAARLLGVGEDQLCFEDGWIFERASSRGADAGKRLSFAEVVHAAYLERVSLSSTGFYRTEGLSFDRQTLRGHPFKYFAYGAAVSEVELDGLTGEHRLLRVDILHDAGDSLNPLVDRGQIEGGFVQGLGWLTCEELVWNAQGVLQTIAPSTYKIPTIHEIPQAFHVRLLERASEPGAVFGAKAVGEPPFMLAISVREAIRQAVAEFAAPTARSRAVDLAIPATPEAILHAIEAVMCRTDV